MDTTFSTNRQGYHLVGLVTRDANNHRRCVCMAFTDQLVKERYRLIVETLSRWLGGNVKIVFTDGEAAMASGLKELEGLLHFLCIYHKMLNIAERRPKKPKGNDKKEGAGDAEEAVEDEEEQPDDEEEEELAAGDGSEDAQDDAKTEEEVARVGFMCNER